MSCKQLSSLHVIKTKEQRAQVEAMCSQARETVQHETEASVTVCCRSVQCTHRPAGNPKALGGDTGPLGPPLQAPQTRRLKHQTFLFSEPRRLEIRTQVLAGLAPSEALGGEAPPGLLPQRADGRLVPVCAHGHPLVRVCVISSSHKDTSHPTLGPTVMAPLTVITLSRTLSLQTVAFWCWALGLQHGICVGQTQDTIQAVTDLLEFCGPWDFSKRLAGRHQGWLPPPCGNREPVRARSPRGAFQRAWWSFSDTVAGPTVSSIAGEHQTEGHPCFNRPCSWQPGRHSLWAEP